MINAAESVSERSAVEKEIRKLKRRYQQLYKTRKTYSKDTKSIIDIQKKILVSLKNEKDAIETDLNRIKSTHHQVKETKSEELLKEEIEQELELLSQIAEEKQLVSELKQAVLNAFKERQNGSPKTIEDPRATQIRLNQEMRHLESRLHAAITRHDQTMESNRTLREQIATHLKQTEKVNKMEHELRAKYNLIRREEQESKDKDEDLFNHNVELRDKMLNFFKYKESQYAKHVTKLKDQMRNITQDNDFKNFLYIKNKNRTNPRTEEFEKITMRQEIVKENACRHIEVYSHILQDLADLKERGNIQELIRFFVQTEDKNTHLEETCCEIKQDIDALLDHFNQMKEDSNDISSEQSLQSNTELARLIAVCDLLLGDSANTRNAANSRPRPASDSLADRSHSRQLPALDSEISEAAVLQQLAAAQDRNEALVFKHRSERQKLDVVTALESGVAAAAASATTTTPAAAVTVQDVNQSQQADSSGMEARSTSGSEKD